MDSSSARLHQTFIETPPKPSWIRRTVEVMTGVETTSEWVRQDPHPEGGGDRPPGVGIPVEVTLVEAPACHLCEDAKSTLAVLARSYPLTVHVVSIEDEVGRELMQTHRAPMSPLVLLDGKYFSSGRLPLRKIENRLKQAQQGETS
jgi:glutaredoxin